MQAANTLIKSLLRWYRRRGRHSLPWRHTNDPYRILVSEIMLQQTQVDRVIPKYRAFLKRFSTLDKLAKTPASAVLRTWQGMGYNRRALYLKRLAEICVTKHGGRVPTTYEALRALPGVGDYTAKAVLAFACNKPVALYDTNIRRIFARVFFCKNPSAVKEKLIVRRIESIFYAIPVKIGIRNKSGTRVKPGMTDKARSLALTGSAAYHSALMDLGATVCKTQPLCGICPLQKICKVGRKYIDSRDFKYLDARDTPKLQGLVVRNPQSKFEGSDRQLRGRVIEHLRKNSAASFSHLMRHSRESGNLGIRAGKIDSRLHGNDRNRLRRILESLLRDGLITKKRSIFMLPR